MNAYVAVPLVVVFIACSAIVGCRTSSSCCPQCRANHEFINVINDDLLDLERSVSDMKRGYRTIPVKVGITNAWDFGKKDAK